MITVKASITPMCSSSPTLSSTNRAPGSIPDSSRPTPSEMNAPDSYGNVPSAADAPRKRNIVHSTLKIMKRISQAPPVCEP